MACASIPFAEDALVEALELSPHAVPEWCETCEAWHLRVLHVGVDIARGRDANVEIFIDGASIARAVQAALGFAPRPPCKVKDCAAGAEVGVLARHHYERLVKLYQLVDGTLVDDGRP